jgi:hypothetical protein
MPRKRKNKGQFKKDETRAVVAGIKGGTTRQNDPDIKSGELGRKGAKSRWEDDDR